MTKLKFLQGESFFSPRRVVFKDFKAQAEKEMIGAVSSFDEKIAGDEIVSFEEIEAEVGEGGVDNVLEDKKTEVLKGPEDELAKLEKQKEELKEPAEDATEEVKSEHTRKVEDLDKKIAVKKKEIEELTAALDAAKETAKAHLNELLKKAKEERIKNRMKYTVSLQDELEVKKRQDRAGKELPEDISSIIPEDEDKFDTFSYSYKKEGEDGKKYEWSNKEMRNFWNSYIGELYVQLGPKEARMAAEKLVNDAKNGKVGIPDDYKPGENSEIPVEELSSASDYGVIVGYLDSAKVLFEDHPDVYAKFYRDFLKRLKVTGTFEIGWETAFKWASENAPGILAEKEKKEWTTGEVEAKKRELLDAVGSLIAPEDAEGKLKKRRDGITAILSAALDAEPNPNKWDALARDILRYQGARITRAWEQKGFEVDISEYELDWGDFEKTRNFVGYEKLNWDKFLNGDYAPYFEAGKNKDGKFFILRRRKKYWVEKDKDGNVTYSGNDRSPKREIYKSSSSYYWPLEKEIFGANEADQKDLGWRAKDRIVGYVQAMEFGELDYLPAEERDKVRAEYKKYVIETMSNDGEVGQKINAVKVSEEDKKVRGEVAVREYLMTPADFIKDRYPNVDFGVTIKEGPGPAEEAVDEAETVEGGEAEAPAEGGEQAVEKADEGEEQPEAAPVEGEAAPSGGGGPVATGAPTPVPEPAPAPAPKAKPEETPEAAKKPEAVEETGELPVIEATIAQEKITIDRKVVKQQLDKAYKAFDEVAQEEPLKLADINRKVLDELEAVMPYDAEASITYQGIKFHVVNNQKDGYVAEVVGATKEKKDSMPALKDVKDLEEVKPEEAESKQVKKDEGDGPEYLKI